MTVRVGARAGGCLQACASAPAAVVAAVAVSCAALEAPPVVSAVSAVSVARGLGLVQQQECEAC